MVGYQLRFHPMIKLIKNIIDKKNMVELLMQVLRIYLIYQITIRMRIIQRVMLQKKTEVAG